jgi:hypothetical protein
VGENDDSPHLGKAFGSNYVRRKGLKLKIEKKVEKCRKKAETEENVWPFFALLNSLIQTTAPSKNIINELENLYTPDLIANIDESGINLSWSSKSKVVTINKEDRGEVISPNRIGNITFLFTIFMVLHCPQLSYGLPNPYYLRLKRIK